MHPVAEGRASWIWFWEFGGNVLLILDVMEYRNVIVNYILDCIINAIISVGDNNM